MRVCTEQAADRLIAIRSGDGGSSGDQLGEDLVVDARLLPRGGVNGLVKSGRRPIDTITNGGIGVTSRAYDSP